MAWSDAIANVSKLFSTIIDKVMGNQTLEERSIETQAEWLAAKVEQAIYKGDMGAANHYRAELRKLRDESLSKRAGRS